MSSPGHGHADQCLLRWEEVLGTLELAVAEAPAGPATPATKPAESAAGLPPLPAGLAPRATALLAAIDRRRLELALERDAVAAELAALGRSERPGGTARGGGPLGTTCAVL